jgi:hypothetical protein
MAVRAAPSSPRRAVLRYLSAMAGKDGWTERLGAGLGRLFDVLDAQIERLAADPEAHAPAAERVGRAVRTLAASVRGLADAGLATARLSARDAACAENEQDGEADEEEPRLSPEALEELRDDVRRRYSRFDQGRADTGPADRGFRPAGAAGGAAGLAGAGARAAAAAGG